MLDLAGLVKGRPKQKRKQKQPVPGLCREKVGKRVDAAFLSPTAPMAKITVQFVELSPFGENNLELKTM